MMRNWFSLVLTASALNVLCSGGLWAQPTGQTSQAPPFDRPLEAHNAWPSGTFGVDYNVTDDEGFRHGPWVRVYESGELYYAGTFDHGTPTGSWWYFRENGTALTHLVHKEDPTQSDATVFTTDGLIAAQGGYLHPPSSSKAKPLNPGPPPLCARCMVLVFKQRQPHCPHSLQRRPKRRPRRAIPAQRRRL